MKRIAATVIAVLVVFAAGYWPQSRQVTAMQAELTQLQERMATAESRVRLGVLLGRLLQTLDAVSARNYGDAAALSTAFFDAVRQEAATSQSDAAAVLTSILQTRDRVTTMIAAADPGLTTLLKDHELSLRRALGYPVAQPSR